MVFFAHYPVVGTHSRSVMGESSDTKQALIVFISEAWHIL